MRMMNGSTDGRTVTVTLAWTVTLLVAMLMTVLVSPLPSFASGQKTCTVAANEDGSGDPCRAWRGGNGVFELTDIGDATSVKLQYRIKKDATLRDVVTRTDRGGESDCSHTADDQICHFWAPADSLLFVIATGGTAGDTVTVNTSGGDQTSSLTGLVGSTQVCTDVSPSASALLLGYDSSDTDWCPTNDINAQNGDADICIHGSSDNLLCTDASTNRVGIGTATPGALLQVNDGSAGAADLFKVDGSNGDFRIDSIGGLIPGYLAANMNVNSKEFSNTGVINFSPTGTGFTTDAEIADNPADTIGLPGKDAYADAATNIGGGDLDFDAGNGASNSAGDADGGDVKLDGGIGYGTGSDGNVILAGTRGNVGIGTATPNSALDVNGIISTCKQTYTLGVGATTVTATCGLFELTGDAGGNTLATITGSFGAAGSRVALLFTDGLITITDDNSHTQDTVDLSAAFTSADDTTLELIHDGTSWYELSRSVN